METSVIVLSVLVLLLAVGSAVLGFMADSTKLTPDEIKYSDGVCVYPAKPAHMLGIGAVGLLAAAQIIASVVGVYCGCSKSHGGAVVAPSPKQKKAIISSAVLSWVAAAVAAADYVRGAAWNAGTTRDAIIDGLLIECQYLRGSGFTRAALLSIAAAVLGISAYAMLRAPASGAEAEPKPDGQQQPAAGGPAQNALYPPPPPPRQVYAHAQAQTV